MYPWQLPPSKPQRAFRHFTDGKKKVIKKAALYRLWKSVESELIMPIITALHRDWLSREENYTGRQRRGGGGGGGGGEPSLNRHQRCYSMMLVLKICFRISGSGVT